MWKIIKYKLNERLIRIFFVFFVLLALCGLVLCFYNNVPLVVTAVLSLSLSLMFSAAMVLYCFSSKYGADPNKGPRVDEDILKLPASPSDKFFGCILSAMFPAIAGFLVAMLMIAVRATFGGESLAYEPTGKDTNFMLCFVSLDAYLLAMASAILYSELGRNKPAFTVASCCISLVYPIFGWGVKYLQDIGIPLVIYVAFWIVCLATAIYLTRKAYKRFKSFELLAA